MASTDATQVASQEPSGIWSIERVVALGTPLFTAAAGYCFTLLGKALPGVSLSRGQFTALFVSGAIAALTAAITWLLGRQKWTHTSHVAGALAGEARQVLQEVGPSQVRQIEAALEAHEAAVVAGVADKVGAPPSAEEVAKQIVGQLWPSQKPQEAPTVVTQQPVQ